MLRTNFKLAVYCFAYLLLVACIIVIVFKLLFWPPCYPSGPRDTACLVDGWSIAGLAATVLGVGAAILTLLGAFTVAAWWLSLDKRIKDQVDTLYALQKAEVEKQMHALLVEQQNSINNLIQPFQSDLIVLESRFQTLQGGISQLNLWVAETADLAFQALLLSPPDNIDDIATKAIEQFKSPQIVEKMILLYLEMVESYLPSLSGTEVIARAYAPSLFNSWERVLHWYEALKVFYPENEHMSVSEVQVLNTGAITLQLPEMVKRVKEKIDHYRPQIEGLKTRYKSDEQSTNET
jgi:hypothetical protein